MLQDDGARAVAEEDAGVAVLPVDDGGELFRADDENGVVDAGGDELVGGDERVKEAGTGGADVIGGGAGGADLALDMAGGGGEGGVGCAGGDDDQVDGLGVNAGLLDRLLGGAGAHVGSAFTLVGNASFADAGAGHDPLVGGVDHLLQFRVGQDTGGKMDTGGKDGGTTSHVYRKW